MLKKILTIAVIVFVVAFISFLFLDIRESFLRKEIGKKPTDSSLEEVQRRGKLIIGTFPHIEPMTYKDINGNNVGFDIELIKEIASFLKTQIEIKEMPFPELFNAAKERKVDLIISAITITPERMEELLFSTPYVTSGQVLLTKKENNTITKLEDLKGRKVGVARGTEQEKTARKYADEALITFYNDFNDVSLLLDDKVEALVFDYITATVIVKKNPSLKIATELLNEEYFGIATKRGNVSLLKAIEEALREMKRSGRYEELRKKWFK